MEHNSASNSAVENREYIAHITEEQLDCIHLLYVSKNVSQHERQEIIKHCIGRSCEVWEMSHAEADKMIVVLYYLSPGEFVKSRWEDIVFGQARLIGIIGISEESYNTNVEAVNRYISELYGEQKVIREMSLPELMELTHKMQENLLAD